MPNQSYSGTVTRKANGAIEFRPTDPGTFNKLPAMGDEVTLTVEVTRTANEIEMANAEAKAARTVVGVTETTVGDVPIGEGVQVGRGSPAAPPVERRTRR